MKKYFLIFTAIILLAVCLTSCGSDKAKNTADDKKIQIVTTIFPEYDWVKNILGDNPGNAELTMLLDNGVDLHSYQPTADDIEKISTCDLFIYVGGESDKWVDDALKEAVNKNMVAIDLLDVLGNSAKEEKIIEGMESEEDEKSAEDPEYDEHVWLSLKNAIVFTDTISKALQKIDADHANTYKSNSKAYIKNLHALDTKYETAVSKAPVTTLLFGDRFPFRYMTDDYGLSYYAAFAGCSAETEASFETVTFLAHKADELSLHSIMTIEGKNHDIAKTIVQNTKAKNQQILTLDSMQSTTAKDVRNGSTYISAMKKNLEALKKALK